ncbi:MAG: hypothetical protein RI894_1871 [Bacteroidota bacterium]|jgi:DNA-binding LytR/AlgR family response regulator
MRCLIIDDEPLAQEVLETLIRLNSQLTLVGKCANALEAYQALQQYDNIDLLFLDIQMPQLTGIDFLKSLKSPPMIIFTTAYPQYAAESYELNAIDYLLKPIALARFNAAVQKAQAQLDARQALLDAPLSYNIAASVAPPVSEDFIFVKADKKLVKITFDDILFVEGLKDYVIIRTTQGRVITLQTMKSLEEKLPSDRFRRIHRSYIVAMQRIDAIDSSMVEIAKQIIPIGKNYRDEILEIVGKNRI